MGELKRFLIDDLTRERNNFAKEIMTDIGKRRKEAEARFERLN